MKSVYLDNNATTELDPDVAQCMLDVWKLGPLNGSSPHELGRRGRQIIDEASERIGVHLGASIGAVGGDRLLITSGGTEANNLAIHGLLAGRQGALVASQIEHPSVLEAVHAEARKGREVQWLPVDRHGQISIAALESMIAGGKPIALVSAMLANNETGAIQPIAKLSHICRKQRIPLHTDACQAVGRLPIRFDEMGVAAMTFAPHKFHGPCGIGGLIVGRGWQITSLLHGGGQQLGMRPGTEPVALVAGMEEALALATRDLSAKHEKMRRLRDRLESQLSSRIEGLSIASIEVERLPNTSLVVIPSVDRQALMIRLDLAGIACGTGSACASGSDRPSHVLEAMGYSREALDGALRLSNSRLTTVEQIEHAAEVIVNAIVAVRTARSS
jgi:cysteine desulfurase